MDSRRRVGSYQAEVVPGLLTDGGVNREYTFYIESLGCAKNQVDSETMIAGLERDGWVSVDDPAQADLIVVNTCGFIQEAKEESIETILSMKRLHPEKKLIVSGCLSERYGDALREELSEIDGILGNRNPSHLSRVALQTMFGEAEAATDDLPSPPRTKLLGFPGSAYVKISEGCDNRCSYCAIPLIRGGLRSRGPEDILDEVSGLIRTGTREVVLIGQDLASYGLDRSGCNLVDLVEQILGLKGQLWLRLLYMHPDHFPLGLTSLMRGDSRLLPYFDIPFQHAAAGVLERMGRRGSSEIYRDLVQRIRDEAPGSVIRSTFLCGFPGETDRDFEELLRFQERVELDWVGVFSYSREEDTPAYSYAPQVSKVVARKRKGRIESAQIPITQARLGRYVGSTYDLLIEERIEGEEMVLARGYMHAPEVDGLVVLHCAQDDPRCTPGSVVPGKITGRNGFDLEASLCRIEDRGG